MPDDTPTALPTCWWCPECGYVQNDELTPAPPTPRLSSITTAFHWRSGTPCNRPLVEVPLLTPGLSLVQLAAYLSAVGYDVREGFYSDDAPGTNNWRVYPVPDPYPVAAHGPCLVVGVKEKTP